MQMREQDTGPASPAHVGNVGRSTPRGWKALGESFCGAPRCWVVGCAGSPPHTEAFLWCSLLSLASHHIHDTGCSLKAFWGDFRWIPQIKLMALWGDFSGWGWMALQGRRYGQEHVLLPLLLSYNFLVAISWSVGLPSPQEPSCLSESKRGHVGSHITEIPAYIS